MVGRMSKSNRRRRTNSEHQNIPSATEQVSSTNNFVSSPPSSGSLFTNLTSFGLQDYDNFNSDAFLSDFSLLTPMESGKSTEGTSELESTQLNADFNPDQFAIFPIDKTSTEALLSATTPPSLDSVSTSCQELDGTQGSRASDEHLMKYPQLYALSQMIAFLESFVTTKEAAIDEVLRINQAYVAEITKMIDHVQYKQCNSCPMLALTAMELILALYENAIFPGSWKQIDSTCTPSSPPPTPVNNLPNLQFGVFMMDPQEKIAFGKRIICKELQRYTNVTKMLSSERQSRGDNLSFSIVHVRWLVDLESRVETFIKTLQD
jgi:hypothetical protein